MNRPPAAAADPLQAPTFPPGARVLVRGEEWIVRSTRTTSLGGVAVHVTGLSELVRGKEAIFLTEHDTVEELRPEDTELVPDPSPRYRRSRLYLESLLRRTPPTDAALYAGHRAAMDPAPYQLVPAAKALEQLRPRILIADGVGLGKTLEAGVLLTELIRRGRGDRILVVALRSVLAQFQEELWARFTIPLVRLDSVGIQRVRAKIPSNMNPFYYFDRVIISIDTLKKDGKYQRFLEQCRWDAIVIDECQHVAERGRGASRSQRARLAHLLARTTDALILTSATPHDGRPESFASLMNLLDPTAVADPTAYSREDIRGLYERRFKKDVAHEVQSRFQERRVVPERAEASPAEDAVLETLGGLELRTIDRRRKSKGVLFRTTLLKAFLSSPEACAETIRQRLRHKALTEPEDPTSAAHDRRSLEDLLARVEAVEPDQRPKLDRLAELLGEWGYGRGSAGERVVVFSERIATLRFLEQHLRERFGLKEREVVVFHGTLSDQEQKARIEEFGTRDGKVRLLLASDAASEGINLHYLCHRLVHFDVPWSLITMEQRNGRIDRFGQERTPWIHYLLTVPGTPELQGDLRVLERLIEKEQAAHQNLGDVAWLMDLHDPEKEEERVAQGIEGGEDPGAVVPDDPDDSLLELLLRPDAAELAAEERQVETRDPSTFYPDDLAYARAALDELREAGARFPEPEWNDDVQGFKLVAPEDLRRRYEYLPPELRDPNGEVRLTTDRQRVQASYDAARDDEQHWPEWELFWDQHPVAQWLNDRVLASFRRHEAPVLTVPRGLERGEAAVLCQGIVSNQRSQPVRVEWFGVRFRDGAEQGVVPLGELAHATGLLGDLANPGPPDLDGLRALVAPAAERAREHLLELRRTRDRKDVGPRLRDEFRRLKRWRDAALAQVQGRRRQAEESGRALTPSERKRLERREEEVEARYAERERWVNEDVRTSEHPYVRVAAVLVGPEGVQRRPSS